MTMTRNETRAALLRSVDEIMRDADRCTEEDERKMDAEKPIMPALLKSFLVAKRNQHKPKG